MTSAPHFGRIVTAMATPFTADGELDLDGAATLARHLVGHGTETVLVCGTTGESPTLDTDEQFALLGAVIDAVGGGARVMMGTGTNDTARSVALTEKATDEGADAILAVTPYYNKPDQRGLVAHFRAIAAATDRPVLVYDIPGRTSRAIDVDTHVQLAEIGNIAGVKDANEDIGKTSQIVARTPADYQVYSGADAYNLPILAVGGVGFVSVASHVVGPELADLAASFESDPVKARELHVRLLPFFDALFLEPNPAPLKAILGDLGLPAGPVRQPLLDATDATLEALRDGLDHAGISRDLSV